MLFINILLLYFPLLSLPKHIPEQEWPFSMLHTNMPLFRTFIVTVFDRSQLSCQIRLRNSGILLYF